MQLNLELPRRIEEELAAHAAATGRDVVDLIQIAVARFVESDVRKTPQLKGRLLPDLPLDVVEFSPPVDLPLTGKKIPVAATVQTRSKLRPDPLHGDE